MFRKFSIVLMPLILFPINSICSEIYLTCIFDSFTTTFAIDNKNKKMTQNNLDVIQITNWSKSKISGNHSLKYDFPFSYDSSHLSINRINGEIEFIFTKNPTHDEIKICNTPDKRQWCSDPIVVNTKSGVCKKSELKF